MPLINSEPTHKPDRQIKIPEIHHNTWWQSPIQNFASMRGKIWIHRVFFMKWYGACSLPNGRFPSAHPER